MRIRMFSSLFGSNSKESKEAKKPVKSIYDKRIECLERMLELQKDAKYTDEQYINISCIEGKGHESAWKQLEHYTSRYKTVWAACSETLKVQQ